MCVCVVNNGCTTRVIIIYTHVNNNDNDDDDDKTNKTFGVTSSNHGLNAFMGRTLLTPIDPLNIINAEVVEVLSRVHGGSCLLKLGLGPFLIEALKLTVDDLTMNDDGGGGGDDDDDDSGGEVKHKNKNGSGGGMSYGGQVKKHIKTFSEQQWYRLSLLRTFTLCLSERESRQHLLGLGGAHALLQVWQPCIRHDFPSALVCLRGTCVCERERDLLSLSFYFYLFYFLLHTHKYT
jgi:hypothetical protein